MTPAAASHLEPVARIAGTDLDATPAAGNRLTISSRTLAGAAMMATDPTPACVVAAQPAPDRLPILPTPRGALESYSSEFLRADDPARVASTPPEPSPTRTSPECPITEAESQCAHDPSLETDGGGLANLGVGPTARSPITERQLAERSRRLRLVLAYRSHLESGLSPAAAVVRMAAGVSRSTLDRWLDAWIAGGEEALTPGTSTGRPPKAPLSEAEALALRGLVLARSSRDAARFQLAVEDFATHPACSPMTRATILAELDRAAGLGRRPQFPPSWRRQAMPSVQEADRFRGRKAAMRSEQVDRRGLEWIDESGERIPLLPHSIWEMDDASDNEPRVSIDPDTGEEILTRQTLWTQDVYSAAILGFTQVARARDAYRIEDVADHILHCCEAWGMPQILRLEKGPIWDGTLLHGFVPRVAGWPDDEPWGGLSAIIRVVNVHTSKGKGAIESSFNLSQAMLAHRSLSLGRERGEFEASTRALIRSQRTGEADPRFWALGASADALSAAAERFNHRPKFRAAFGRHGVVPADLLRNARGTEIPADQRWRFCPVKRLATVRGGHVESLVEHYPAPFRFVVNGVVDGLHLDHGYQVLVAFHPGRPEEGCHLFNAELGSRNRDGLRRGQWLGVAPQAALAPQVDLSGRADFSIRRRAAAAVTRNFRAIGQALRSAQAQDSHGRIQRAEVGGSRRSPAGQRRVGGNMPASPSVRLAAAVSQEDLRDLLPQDRAGARGGSYSVDMEELRQL